jgi:hypothetical protein
MLGGGVLRNATVGGVVRFSHGGIAMGGPTGLAGGALHDAPQAQTTTINARVTSFHFISRLLSAR